MSLLLNLQDAVSQGILWGVMVLGVYITFRLLDVADLTVDGSFATGGGVCAILLINGWNPAAATVMGMLAGAAAGAITGILHTVCEIPAILAGILTQLALYSINLRIMGKANISMANVDSIFSWLTKATGWKQSQAALLIGVVIAVLIVILLYWFFGTEIGAALRATGNNEDMVRALGENTKKIKIIGLSLSNALVGLSGALICQSQKFADVNSGLGAIVIGLAAIVIGEILLGRLRSFGSKLAAVVVGSAIYFMIRAFVLWLGLNTNDMKLISAVIVVLALSVPVLSQKWKIRRSYAKGGQ